MAIMMYESANTEWIGREFLNAAALTGVTGRNRSVTGALQGVTACYRGVYKYKYKYREREYAHAHARRGEDE